MLPTDLVEAAIFSSSKLTTAFNYLLISTAPYKSLEPQNTQVLLVQIITHIISNSKCLDAPSPHTHIGVVTSVSLP